MTHCDKFIEKAKKIHSGKYDYSKVEYKNNKEKVIIVCPIHGEFLQRPANHLRGQKCKLCINTKLSFGEFINRANDVHNGRYGYMVDYVGYGTKSTIICSEHGEFRQTPSNHISNGRGCPRCAISNNRKISSHSTHDFIVKSTAVHGDKYDYSKVCYVNWRIPVTIVCPDHGEFKQIPNNHLKGCGCTSCSIFISKLHQEILDFIHSIGNFEININDRVTIRPYELDIYIPGKRIAIEVNGLYWHSYNRIESTEEKNKHATKADKCSDSNIELMQIDEDEWRNKKDVVKSIIKSRLLDADDINGRVREINRETYTDFVSKNCTLDNTIDEQTVFYGSFCDDIVNSTMSLIRRGDRWEVTGIVGKPNINKLFSKFIDDRNPTEVFAYDNRRYPNKDAYLRMGFKFDSVIDPTHCYIEKHKTYFRRLIPNPLTEAQNMFNNGYRRLWDAGYYKFIWRKSWL